MPTDVADQAATEQMARAAFERFGRIDGLINNAAMYQRPAVMRILDADGHIWEPEAMFADLETLSSVVQQAPPVRGGDAMAKQAPADPRFADGKLIDLENGLIARGPGRRNGQWRACLASSDPICGKRANAASTATGPN